MPTAHLIATLDVTASPPRVAGVSIIGEPWETATLSHSPRRCYVNLWKAEGRTWEEAVANLRGDLSGPRSYPGMRWAIAWVDAGGPDHPPA